MNAAEYREKFGPDLRKFVASDAGVALLQVMDESAPARALSKVPDIEKFNMAQLHIGRGEGFEIFRELLRSLTLVPVVDTEPPDAFTEQENY